MTETKFKILMHSGEYVDKRLLEKGIYTCSIPHLHDKAETIEKLIAKAKLVTNILGESFISENTLKI